MLRKMCQLDRYFFMNLLILFSCLFKYEKLYIIFFVYAITLKYYSHITLANMHLQKYDITL